MTGRATAIRTALRRPAVAGPLVLAILLVVAAVVWVASSGDGGRGDLGSEGGLGGGSTETATSGATSPTATPEVPRTPAPPASPDGTGSPSPDEAGTGADGGEPEPEDTRPFVPEAEPPVPLDAAAPFGTGVVARLESIEAVEGVAEGPGEVGGPSLEVVVELTNGTAAALPLNATVVELYGGPDEVPGLLLAGSEEGFFSGELAPGASAVGTYVFRIAPELRDVVRVTVSYSPAAPTVLFEGAAPAA